MCPHISVMTRARSYYGRHRRRTEAPAARSCDYPGCAISGEHRAPKSRERLNDYYWFCLEHVRAYNRAWNYFQGMNADAIEKVIRQDTVWERPTWPLGSAHPDPRNGRAIPLDEAIERALGMAADIRRPNPRDPQWEQLSAPDREALAELDLGTPITLHEVKLRYKYLVKRLHPDANGSDRKAEERLKRINAAYGRLKICPHL
jgi:hypothetical protein